MKARDFFRHDKYMDYEVVFKMWKNVENIEIPYFIKATVRNDDYIIDHKLKLVIIYLDEVRK